MGYLTKDDYRKIKNIIDTFIDSPIITDNLFKSLALFLDTKNEPPIKEIQIANHEVSHTSTVDTLRTQKESERADEAMDRFTKKLREENAKRKKNRKVAS